MTVKVSTSFLTTDTDAELVVSTGRIIVAMTGNIHYPTPTPALPDIGTARGEFAAAVGALDGSEAAYVLRDQKRAALVDLMRALSLYVQQNCKNDLTILLSSGFLAQKVDRSAVTSLPAPENCRLRRPAISGQLKGLCVPVDGAVGYQWRIATSTTPTNFTLIEIPTTSASTTFDKLTPGVNYIVQVRAFSSGNIVSDWSDPAMLMCV